MKIKWVSSPGYVVYRVHKYLDFTIREISDKMFYLYRGQDKIGEFQKFKEADDAVRKIK